MVVILIVINIGAAKSFKRPASWESTPDDRQSVIKIIGGVIVQDHGLVVDGETIGCQVIFNAVNWALVKGYWISRTMVEVIDHAGVSLGDKRVVVKKYGYVDKFPQFYTVTLEFWNV